MLQYAIHPTNQHYWLINDKNSWQAPLSIIVDRYYLLQPYLVALQTSEFHAHNFDFLTKNTDATQTSGKIYPPRGTLTLLITMR